MTDIKSLPKWQKYTIIAILFALAIAFTMSGAMVAVIGYMTEKKVAGRLVCPSSSPRR